jgi:transcription elongation factor Elf1
MDIKKLVNKQGVCPFCGHDNLVYNAIEIEGDMAYFPWRCERCGHQGEEWYEFIFMGHNVKDEED